MIYEIYRKSELDLQLNKSHFLFESKLHPKWCNFDTSAVLSG